MELISRKEARALGLTRYFTGKPCSRGHVEERFVSSRLCLKCSNVATLKYKHSHVEIETQRDRLYYRRNIDRFRTYAKKRRKELAARKQIQGLVSQ